MRTVHWSNHRQQQQHRNKSKHIETTKLRIAKQTAFIHFVWPKRCVWWKLAFCSSAVFKPTMRKQITVTKELHSKDFGIKIDFPQTFNWNGKKKCALIAGTWVANRVKIFSFFFAINVSISLKLKSVHDYFSIETKQLLAGIVRLIVLWKFLVTICSILTLPR